MARKLSEAPGTVVGMNTIRVDCGTCEVRGMACGDCVMSVLLGPKVEVSLDDDERNAIDALAEFGLVPPLRLVPRAASDAAARYGT